MKIGILTFHRANNYGAVLQCYALQEALTRLGHEVCVIDYRQAAVETPYKIISQRMFRGIGFRVVLRNLCRMPSLIVGKRSQVATERTYKIIRTYCRITILILIHMPFRIVRGLSFAGFRRKYLRLSATCHSVTDIPPMDAYIVGSDQMWSFQITGGKDDVYLGKFDRPRKSLLFGYAISTNTKSLQSMTDDELRIVCSRFEYISLREGNYAQVVSERTGRKIDVDIDPVLLMGHKFWEGLTNQRFVHRRYVLLYQVRTPKDDRQLLNRKAKLLAKMLHCEVIDAGCAKYSPEDFVSLFRYAQCVMTSSFHATVFSVIFERPLYAVCLCDGQDARYKNLLQSIGAEQLLVDMDFEPRTIEFDYTYTRNRLDELRRQSICRIKEALTQKEKDNLTIRTE